MTNASQEVNLRIVIIYIFPVVLLLDIKHTLNAIKSVERPFYSCR
jgi:L-asparagine transporter-like permease